ncbi:putative RNA-directed DNA polymerase from transposon BS-like protein [Cladobotryum mycophilum]|uniref:RNA-directed DNA polymerase from transposon BS-like protein n=1 Tax=Cladobotryum mycophilum TaxID=491253 RepID=A0ABR0SQ78_9HYPO
MASTPAAPTIQASQFPFELGEITPTDLQQRAREALPHNQYPHLPSTPQPLPQQRTTNPPPSSSPFHLTANPTNERIPTQDATAPAVPAVHDYTQQVLDERAAMYAEEHKVLNAFSTAFDAIAKQFTTDHARKIATALTNAFKSACISALNPKEPPKGNTTTYASVLHNTQGPGPTAPQKPQAHTKHPPGTKETVHPDLRILVRLEKQSPAWQKEPAAIRDVISKALSMPISRIPKATQTATGWAIHTADQGVQREVLERKEEWIRLLGALHAETRQIWYNYIVEECPRTIPTWDGRPVDFNECFREEVITQTGTAPVSFRPTRKNEPHAPTQKMIVSFPTPITKRWRLFGSSRMARYLEKSKLPEQCVWCWDYHSWRHCSRKQRCNRCGKTDHDFETCQRPEQCPNCLEPAPPNHKDCSMKPYKARGAIQRPTQHQRKTARTTGAQRYRQRNPEHTTAPNEDRTQFTEARFSPHLANEKERPAGEERDNDPITIDAEPLSPQPPEGPEEEEPTNPITPPGPGSATSLSTEAPAASLVVSPGAFPETKKKVPPQLNHQSMTRPNSSNKDLARTKTLRIFQANVGKIGPAHDTALALADTEEFDIILMQEPWVSLKGDSMTKTHPGYRTYSPVNSWEGTRDRPRVMTYIRRNLELDADQTRPVATRDILWIKTSDITIVNIYRDPDVPETLEAILTWPIPDRCLIAGDFNARHCSWEPGANAEHQGGRIADWAEETELAQLVPAAPTNPRNTTIDLAFTNIPLAEAAVEEHLLTSADHYPITITIPEIRLQSRPRKRARLRTSKETQRFLSLIQEGARDLPTQTTNTDDLDSLATAIIELIQISLETAGTPPRQTQRAAPWWTEECAEAALKYRQTRRRFPLGFCRAIQEARKALQKTVRRTKRQFWRTIIDEVKDGAGIYKLARWAQRTSPFQTPPLQATLERRAAGDDISQPWAPLTPTTPLPFSLTVTPEQTRYAALHTGNTAPGADGVTVQLLQLSWDHLGTHIHRLYAGCLAVGYHPQIFKSAEVVMIPKPGKRDLTKPRAWRPISLLSCLSKGLERLIAKRMAWTSVQHEVLDPKQAGALPKRSAVDLAAALIHDIDQALMEGKVATLVTMDVQGAFDAVLCNRLLLRLREQGWPTTLVRWVESFMTGRQASVRLQDTTIENSPYNPIYLLGNRSGRFGYADDTAILRIGNTIEETVSLANADVAELSQWGTENAVSFDPDKTEVMHFARHKKQIQEAPPVLQGTIEKQPEPAMRWLGIWFDSSLCFRAHVDKWATKALTLAHHLRSLTNTQRGPLPKAVRRAVLGCIEPILLYGIEAWYPGLTRPSVYRQSKGVIVNSRILHLHKRLSRPLLKGIRAILPTWDSTPLPVLYRESGILPIDQLIEARRLRFATRLLRLDHRHPLAQRLQKTNPSRESWLSCIKPQWVLQGYASKPRKSPSRLERTAALIDAKCPRPRLLLKDTKAITDPFPSKEKATELLNQWASEARDYLIVYSDGSQLQDSATGWGFVILRDGQLLQSGHGRLGLAEVYDGEIRGALEGLRAAAQIQNGEKITVCIDSTAALTSLMGTPSDSSQAEALAFQELATELRASLRWCPGHMGIPGNEMADEQAKLGASLPNNNNTITLAAARRIARRKPLTAFQQWWKKEAPASYQRLQLQVTLREPPELSLTRNNLHRLIAARSGHGDFADYYTHKYPGSTATRTCSCGRNKTLDHIFYCRKVNPKHRIKLGLMPSVTIAQYLGPDFERFIKLVNETGFFQKICPRN